MKENLLAIRVSLERAEIGLAFAMREVLTHHSGLG
jgi:hypothetical protein